MSDPTIRPGIAVEVRDVHDRWLSAVAASNVEGTHRNGKKIHDFPVVWVDIAGVGDPVPWPADAVRIPGAHSDA
jgi:hypothetical protein